jgi:ArsR family transcriptional regulator
MSLFNLPEAAYNLKVDISTTIETSPTRLERFFRPDISKIVELIDLAGRQLSMSQTLSTLEQAAVLGKALSDPNRLRILDTLMQGISCNGELNDRLGLPPNLLSHHLNVLKKAGLITSRRDAVDGRWIYYAVDQAAVEQWRAWFSNFLDPARLQPRCLCGPEGELATTPQLYVTL